MSAAIEIFFVLFIFLITITSSKEEICTHKAPELHEVVHSVHIESHHVMRKRSIDQHFRLHTVYDASISVLSHSVQNLIKNDLIPNAVTYWEKTLSVRHTSVPIKLQRHCEGVHVRYRTGDPHAYCVEGCSFVTKCGETVVPPEHLDACREAPEGETHRTSGSSGPGVNNTDFVLYVSAIDTKRCDIGTTVAYAAYCQLETAFDRPVAGYVNLCPGTLSTKKHDMAQMHSTIKHEMLHALGFSAGLYAFFRDTNGEPLTPRLPSTGKPRYNQTLRVHQWSENTIKSVTYKDWKVKSGRINKRVSLIVTPNVQREVRQHFNCPALEGAELEDQDIIGTALSHWEKRIFENEAMTGTYTQNPVISRVTLAVLEDTGWYKVDYSMAETLKWGQGLGCDFVYKSCMEWIVDKRNQNEHIHPYCEVVKRSHSIHTECTEDRTAVALCNLVEYETDLPKKYQYFDSIPGVADKYVSRYGGLVALADYCPYIQEFTWRSNTSHKEIVRSSQCDMHSDIEDGVNYILESHGDKSLCFEHKGEWRLQKCDYIHTVEHWGSGCYKYSCSPVVGLSVIVHGVEYPCRDGMVHNISISTDHWYHTGNIICPPCQEICGAELPEGCPVSYNIKVPAHSYIKDSKPVIPCNSVLTLHHHCSFMFFISLLIASLQL